MTAASLTAWRERLHLNRVQAAAALGCSREALRAWEEGRSDVPLYIALAAAAVAQGLPPIR